MIEYINELLNDQFIKTLIVMIGSVFAGYTMQPIPPLLNKLFTYHIFKFIILFIVGIAMLHPINKKKLSIIIIVSILLLTTFELMRK